jgi:hypothetical protein
VPDNRVTSLFLDGCDTIRAFLIDEHSNGESVSVHPESRKAKLFAGRFDNRSPDVPGIGILPADLNVEREFDAHRAVDAAADRKRDNNDA